MMSIISSQDCKYNDLDQLKFLIDLNSKDKREGFDHH